MIDRQKEFKQLQRDIWENVRITKAPWSVRRLAEMFKVPQRDIINAAHMAAELKLITGRRFDKGYMRSYSPNDYKVTCKEGCRR